MLYRNKMPSIYLAQHELKSGNIIVNKHLFYALLMHFSVECSNLMLTN